MSAGAPGRAQRAFWTVTAVALLAMGALSTALAATPGPMTGLLVIGAGTVLVVTLTLAARVLMALDRTRPSRRRPTRRR